MSLDGPRRILEIGPGTGAFTRRIVKNLREGDRFDLVEINEGFAEHLRRRFETDKDYARVAEQCEVHCVPLQEFRSPEGDESYDAVISGLPLNNFSPELVVELVDASVRQVRPNGTFSMFEYMYVRPLRSRVGAKKTRERMKVIEDIMQERFDEHRFKQDWVFANVLPAWVQHLRVGEGEITIEEATSDSSISEGAMA